jgi:DNA-binding IclR family transcriptional regulator
VLEAALGAPKIRSVVRAFALLKGFRSSDEWLTSAELSRRANIAESSGHRLIQTLVDTGALLRGANNRFRPGMILISLSQHVAVGDVLKAASEAVLPEFSVRLDVTMNLACLQGTMVTYIAKIGTPTSILTYPVPNSQFEPYYSALGKVLLAALPQDEMEAIIFDGELVPLTPFTIVDRQVLRAKIEDVRRCGFALDDRESRNDICCLAVPVYDPVGRTIAAVSAADFASRMTPARQEVIRSALCEATILLTQKIFPYDAPHSKALIGSHSP